MVLLFFIKHENSKFLIKISSKDKNSDSINFAKIVSEFALL